MKKLDYLNVLSPSMIVVFGGYLLSFIGVMKWAYLALVAIVLIVGQLIVFNYKKSIGLTKTTGITCFLVSINIITSYVILNGYSNNFTDSILMISLALYFFLVVTPAVSTKKNILFYS